VRASRSVAWLVALLLAVAGACADEADPDGAAGGGDAELTEEEQAYVDAALEDFDPQEEAPMTEDDARCIATSMVEDVGVERLEEMGLSPESFSEGGELPEGAIAEAEAQDLVDGITECIDVRALFLAGLDEDGSLSPEAEECLTEAFDEELVTRTMVVLLTQGEDALADDSGVGAELMRAFLACPGVIE
jgi:hypothetical protein